MGILTWNLILQVRISQIHMAIKSSINHTISTSIAARNLMKGLIKSLLRLLWDPSQLRFLNLATSQLPRESIELQME